MMSESQRQLITVKMLLNLHKKKTKNVKNNDKSFTYKPQFIRILTNKECDDETCRNDVPNDELSVTIKEGKPLITNLFLL